MRIALIALALTLPAASSALPPAARAPTAPRGAGAFVPSQICGDSMKPRDARSPDAVKPKRLGELPSGDLTLAVVNKVGDCIEPVTVRQGYGVLGDGLGR
ncbi:MAG TPA: hypothetical protein VF574_06255 [Allosphingosinicella sp.]|jgi:hypothetical protein